MRKLLRKMAIVCGFATIVVTSAQAGMMKTGGSGFQNAYEVQGYGLLKVKSRPRRSAPKRRIQKPRNKSRNITRGNKSRNNSQSLAKSRQDKAKRAQKRKQQLAAAKKRKADAAKKAAAVKKRQLAKAKLAKSKGGSSNAKTLAQKKQAKKNSANKKLTPQQLAKQKQAKQKSAKLASADAAKKKRSDSAKKGWETRRANQANADKARESGSSSYTRVNHTTVNNFGSGYSGGYPGVMYGASPSLLVGAALLSYGSYNSCYQTLFGGLRCTSPYGGYRYYSAREAYYGLPPERRESYRSSAGSDFNPGNEPSATEQERISNNEGAEWDEDGTAPEGGYEVETYEEVSVEEAPEAAPVVEQLEVSIGVASAEGNYRRKIADTYGIFMDDVKLKAVTHEGGSAAIVECVKSGKCNIGVTQDGALINNMGGLAYLEKGVYQEDAVLVTKSGHIDGVKDLHKESGMKIGVVGGAAIMWKNFGKLDSGYANSRNGGKGPAVVTVKMADVGRYLKSGKVDAVLLVSSKNSDSVAKVGNAAGIDNLEIVKVNDSDFSDDLNGTQLYRTSEIADEAYPSMQDCSFFCDIDSYSVSASVVYNKAWWNTLSPEMQSHIKDGAFMALSDIRQQ